MAKSNARIDRVHGSWRVRVFGLRPKFFADSHYGGERAALTAAREWRGRHWDGRDRRMKLSEEQRRAISRSTEHYMVLARRYNISPNYVHRLRRERR